MKLDRPQNIIIQSALQSMDSALLERSRCYFGGGTATVLMHGEYRLSLDVDFLCADVDGYRELRSAITENGAKAIFGPDVETVREFMADAKHFLPVSCLCDSDGATPDQGGLHTQVDRCR